MARTEPGDGRPQVALGISGGIAAYKAALIVRGLQRGGARVSVIMTRNATRFVTPLTLQTLAGERVIVDQFEDPGAEWDVEHVSLARTARCLLVAPATANILGKFARGIADDFLSTFYLAFAGPVFLAPAMNVVMYRHPAVEANLRRLRARGARIIEPGEGWLACGDTGAGRLAEPEVIVEAVLGWLAAGQGALNGRTVLVTAGPTREALDPVRFLSNPSSGRMGHALAREAARRGARVFLVSGPTALPAPAGCQTIYVESCAEMQREVEARFAEAEVVIMAAAPADYRPAAVAAGKVRKGEGKQVLELLRTPDILAGLGAKKGSRILVGFAAETEADPEPAALRKLAEKNLDLIVANWVGLPGQGFGAVENAGVALDRRGGRTELPLMTKEAMAARILDLVGELHAAAPGE